MAVSPNKLPIRTGPPAFDTSSIKSPESPEKTRSLRKLQSHNQLSSTQFTVSSQQRQPSRNALTVRASTERFNQGSSATLPSKTPQTLPSRTRANSDALLPFERQPKFQRKPLTAITSNVQSHSRKSSLEATLREGPPKDSVQAGLLLLRHSILTSGVEARSDGTSNYRIYLWLALLNISPIPTDDYLALVRRGASPAYEKINQDVHRTLKGDALFHRRVKDSHITRVLNATAWRLHDSQKQKEDSRPVQPSTSRPRSPIKSEFPEPVTPQSRPRSPTKSNNTNTDDISTQVLYNQGMNVLAAPFLYASRSETQAYALFTELLTTHLPTYLTPSLSGAHHGVTLVEKVLEIINPSLSSFLLSKNLPAKVYAFSSLLTLCACTAPLAEVLKLWDFLFAFGTGLNVIAIVAQVLLLKDKLTAEGARPSEILRDFRPLDAKKVIEMTVWIVGQIPEDLYAEVIRHGYVGSGS